MGLYTKAITEAFGFEEKEKNVFYGIYNGYEVTLHVAQQGIDLFLNFYGDVQLKRRIATIFQTSGSQKLTNTEPSVFGLHSLINGMTLKSTLAKIKEKLDLTTDYLREQNITGIGYCMNCGKNEMIVETVRINDVYVTLDSECMSKYEALVQKAEQNFEAQPNNYGKGILGALLGALIGAVSWVVIYLLGFLSAISGILAVFLGDLFYIKFGGKPNKAKTIIVASISLVAILLTCLVFYIYAANLEMANLNITGVSSLSYILDTPEWKEAFVHDMVMNTVFTVIGVVAQFFSTKKKDQTNRMRISK